MDRPAEDPPRDTLGPTRERLLDAAERLFAEAGYPATSLRQITAAAGANLAAVNYHFGSKEALFHAVFRRRVGPVNRERLALLDELERSHAPQLPPLRAVLRALVEPAAALRRTPEGRPFAALIARSLSADGPHWSAIAAELEPLRERFLPLFAALCPELPPAALLWRLQFTLAALCGALGNSQRLQEVVGPHCDPDDVPTLVHELVEFAAQGLGAPPAPAQRVHP
jgi:AcrR family transcriptional regulator